MCKSNETRLLIIDMERRRTGVFVVVVVVDSSSSLARRHAWIRRSLTLVLTSPSSSDNYFDVGRSPILSTDDYFNWLCLFFCSSSSSAIFSFLSLSPSLSLQFLFALKTATSRPLFSLIFFSHSSARRAVIGFYCLDIPMSIFLFQTI